MFEVRNTDNVLLRKIAEKTGEDVKLNLNDFFDPSLYNGHGLEEKSSFNHDIGCLERAGFVVCSYEGHIPKTVQITKSGKEVAKYY